MDLDEVDLRLRQLQRGGRLSPADVVEDARDPTSPLHSYFEWDDAEAAHQYRLGQARYLIRRIKLETTVHDIPITVNRFLRDPDEKDVYRDILTVPRRSDTSRRIIIDEMQRVISAAKRARAIAAVLGTAEDITEIIKLAESVIRRARITDEPRGYA